jgi:hypothetical protein
MPSPNWLTPEVIAAIEAGRTLNAIKLLQESTGLGLAEAREAVDQYGRSLKTPEAASAPERDAKLLVDSLRANEPSPHGSVSPAAPRKRAGLLWLVLLLVAAAYLAYRFWGGGS